MKKKAIKHPVLLRLDNEIAAEVTVLAHIMGMSAHTLYENLIKIALRAIKETENAKAKPDHRK